MDLHMMYEDCKKYQDKILTYKVPDKVQKATYLLFCMQNEIQEVANCMQWKNWKVPRELTAEQYGNILGEMADILFFYFELCTIFNIPVSLLEQTFYRKMKVNYKRIEEEDLKHRMGEYTDVRA